MSATTTVVQIDNIQHSRTPSLAIGWGIGYIFKADAHTNHAKRLPVRTDVNVRRISFFRVYSRSEAEIVVGEDDKHLDFRVSLFCSPATDPQAGRTLTVSTAVQCHNFLGKSYLFAIALFHRLVVKASLRRAAEMGWPRAGAKGASSWRN